MADVVGEIARAGSDRRRLGALARRIAGDPGLIAEVVAGLGANAARQKYGCEKVLRLLSEIEPRALFPHIGALASLLSSENSFLRWGSIITVANLLAADDEGCFDRVLGRYFRPLRGPELVPAANTIAGAAVIARGRAELAARAVREILKVERAQFLHRGQPSPECRNVAIGHAVQALGQLSGSLGQKKAVLEFVTRQLENPRPAVRKKARSVLERWSGAGAAGRATIRIRRERPGDGAALRRIDRTAFGQHQEADLVDALRRSCPGLLSLVALEGERAVGHILFSPAVIEPVGTAAGPIEGMALAPMAVLPSCQRRGVGSRLVRRGLEILRKAGTPFVIVLGHPAYYPRFGFRRASLHGLRCQWEGVPDEAFMALVLDQARMRGVSGLARYRPEFDAAMQGDTKL